MLTDEEFARARRAYLETADVGQALFDELAEVASNLIRYGHLPASYSPYGQWDTEAAQEVLQMWVEKRLLEDGGLAELLHRAGGVGSFRRLAQASLRQFVIGARERSHSQNLYRRCSELLAEDSGFTLLSPAARRQDAVWGLTGDESRVAFSGSEQELFGRAYSLGDFELTIYKASSRKLEPLLSTPELRRFLAGLLAATGPLSLTQIMRALELRFQLDSPAPGVLDDELRTPPEQAVERVVVGREAGLAVITDLSERQCKVLLGRRAEVTIESLAEELGCSPGTIDNDQKAIAAALRKRCDSDGEAKKLLKIVGDLLYEAGGDG